MNRGIKSLLFIALMATVLFGWISAGHLPRALHADATSHYEELQLFTDVLSIVRKSYVEEVSMREMMRGAINGMLSALDPHSSYLPPDMYREMRIDTSGEFGGLGIEITVQDNILTIVSPIEGTPAHRAGLQSGDQILKVEDRFTKDMGIMDAVKLMRGPKGTTITITIMREGFEAPREFTLVREVIKVRSVRFRTLVDGYGYVRIAQFQERTADDLRQALKTLHRDNPEGLQGLVLDMRNNPGGLLDQAVKVADTFLSEGLIVYTEGREEGSRMRFNAASRGTEPDYPMVVLINNGSASASEIVAGALQDHKRAIVMGTQTFGKGSVQTIIPLSDDSGLRLTTARYYTPLGTSIQATGITPDIVVRPMEVREMDEGSVLNERDLRNHFDTQPRERGEGRPVHPRHTLSGEDQEDYQLMRALDLLKGWQMLKIFDRPAA